MTELLKLLALIAAGAVAIKLLTRTMTPTQKKNPNEVLPPEIESDE